MFKKHSKNYNRYSISAHFSSGKYIVEVDDNLYNCALILTQEVELGDCQEAKIFFDTSTSVNVEQISVTAGAIKIRGEWEFECFKKMYAKALEELAFLKEGSKGEL